MLHLPLRGKEPQRQVGKDMTLTSGSLGGVMGSSVAQNVREDSIPSLGAIFLIVIA